MNFHSRELNAELGADERLIWWGKPKQGSRFGPYDAFLIPFSLVWGGGVLGIAAPQEGFWSGPGVFALFPLIFIGAAFYILIGRYFHDAWRRSRIIYGITDKRALILSSKGINSVRLSENQELNIKRHRNGRMTILFGPNASMFSFGAAGMRGNPWSGAPMVPSFEEIEDGERVYAEIKKIVGL